MNDPNLKEKKKMLTLRVKNNIENEEWEKLIAAFPVAEEFDISNGLLKKAATKIGEYFRSRDNYYKAVIFYNKARIRDLSDSNSFSSFVDSALKFFTNNAEEFSKNDLVKFKQDILPIIDFHKLNYLNIRKSLTPQNNYSGELITDLSMKLKISRNQK